jgi:hypothetical protein
VYRSSDNGTSWAGADSGLIATWVTSLVAGDTNIFVGTFLSGVFLSTDSGTTWTAVNKGLTNGATHSLAIIDHVLYVGTDAGVFLSSNSGASWKAVNTGLDNTAVYSIAGGNGYLFAGTYGQCLWRRPLSEILTGMVEPAVQHSVQFSLQQNYPNPFNPSTNIRYALPQRSYVTLVVYNTLGQQVATVVNESEDAGYHDVRFDGSGLASGVYFYRIQAGTFVQAKKLVVLR